MPGVIALALYPAYQYRRQPRHIHLDIEQSAAQRHPWLRALALLGAVLSALIAVMNSISTMAVRDFILRFRPQTSETAQVVLGRVAIAVAMLMGVGAAAIIAWQPEGVYKYLQTISIYLVMPLHAGHRLRHPEQTGHLCRRRGFVLRRPGHLRAIHGRRADPGQSPGAAALSIPPLSYN